MYSTGNSKSSLDSLSLVCCVMNRYVSFMSGDGNPIMVSTMPMSAGMAMPGVLLRQQARSLSQGFGENCSIHAGPPAKPWLPLHQAAGFEGDAPASQLGGPHPAGLVPPVI